MSLYYGGKMTQGKLLEFLENIGISMGAGYLSNLLIRNQEDFEVEYKEVCKSWCPQVVPGSTLTKQVPV